MRRAALALTGCLLLAGCGGQEDLSVRASVLLQADADALATAARSGNSAAVRSALAALKSHVAAQREAGEVSAARAGQVLAAAEAVAGAVAVPKPSPSPSPAAKATESSDDEKGRGKGKGRDDDKDD